MPKKINLLIGQIGLNNCHYRRFLVSGKVFSVLLFTSASMKKVLIIDDEKDLGLILKNFFTKKKYEVYVSYTIEDGMKVLEEVMPDYIFLDNNLPDGSGWGKTEYILKKYPAIELNLITAYHVPKTSATSFRILEKPIRLEELDKLFC
jgi:DNA-binding NtrC family response regulator